MDLTVVAIIFMVTVVIPVVFVASMKDRRGNKDNSGGGDGAYVGGGHSGCDHGGGDCGGGDGGGGGD
jgi:hypothetical protein